MRATMIFFAASLLASGAAATAQTTTSAGGADWIAEGSLAYDRLGRHVAAAGDVNGDGFDDVLIAATARIHLYLGSASGLPTAPSWTFVGDRLNSFTYYRGVAAGDVNGDGYDDVAVGDPRYDGTFTDGGRVLLFPGSAAGLSAAPSWEARSDRYLQFLGDRLAAGDIDGDGFSDLVVQHYQAIQVYRGSASGLGQSPDWIIQPIESAAGSGIAGGPVVSDLNGDGYADLAFSQLESHNKVYGWQINIVGRLYVFSGSASGPGAGPARVLDLDLAGGNMWPDIGPGGDVDGDGLGDVVVAMEGALGPVFEPGLAKQTESALLHRGGKAMLRAGTDTIVSGLPNRTLVTRYVGEAGDLDGDGFGDLIVPESFDPLPGYSFTPVHLLLVFRGRGNGPDRNPAVIIEPEQSGDAFPASAAAAGDINGDGFDDLVAGAPGYDGALPDQGRVYLFHGRAAF